MKKSSLNAQKRTLIGRKVKQLRKRGQLPASVYGKKVASISITVGIEDFERVFSEAGETGLVELQINNQTHPVLIKNIQLHPVNGKPLHIDFYQVDLKEKVKARVPLKIISAAPAVEQKIGVLLQLLDELEVEALPTNLPEHIEVDISRLEKIDDVIKVGGLVLPSEVLVLSDKDQELVKIGQLITKEAEALAQAEAAAAAAATPTEGATPTAPTVEVKTEANKEAAIKSETK